MVGIVAISPLSLPSLLKPSSRNLRLNSRICFPERIPPNQKAKLKSLATFSHFSNQNVTNLHSHLPIKAASSSSSSSAVGSAEYIEEPTTNVKFQTLLRPPWGTALLSLLGIGYREKVFAIIGVKVYAAGLYVNQSIFTNLDNWKGRTATEIQEDSSIFYSIFQAPVEKSLQIVLVRDVDGKTFWNALDESVSPRIKSPTPVDELALSTFSNVFRGRSLKKGTSIFLTWLNLTKMLVSVSSDGMPSGVDATIGSANVTFALFDVFLGANAVSPTLKASVANGLEKAIN